MNQFVKHIKVLALVLVAFTSSSCEDFLNRTPLDTLTDFSYWETEDHLRLAANGCISYFRDKSKSVDMENLGDNIIRHQVSDYQRISTGNFGSDVGAINSEWVYNYDGIRRCNHFLENYKKAKVDSITKERYAGEVRFMRAYMYSYLINFFGDVQMITKTLQVSDPEVYGTRQSKEEVLQWTLSEFDAAAQRLPVSRPLNEYGRPTKGMALAFKSRLALYHQKWDVAETAAKAVMDLNVYELYKAADEANSYKELFLWAGRASRNANNKEVIAARVYNSNASISHNLSRELQVPDQQIRFSPTRSLIDDYLCSDGKPISISPLYAENSYNDLFQNRDPRLKMTILTPGSPWGGKDDGDDDANPNDVYFLPKFKHDKKGAVTLTGWYFSKFVELTTVSVYAKDENDIPLMRYAEVLLNWAEARYEQGKLTQSDINMSINLIRSRAGMKAMNLVELQAWGLDIRDEIRRERRIELVMEGERYLDILRWKKGELLAQDVKGIKIYCAPNINDVIDLPVDDYGNLIIQTSRTFDPAKNYLWPIPFIQWERNPNLGNNPGW